MADNIEEHPVKPQELEEAVRLRLRKERSASRQKMVIVALGIWTSLMAPLTVAAVIYVAGRINTSIDQGVQRDKDLAATRSEIKALHEAFDDYKRSNDTSVAEMKRKQDGMDKTLTQISTILSMKGMLPNPEPLAR